MVSYVATPSSPRRVSFMSIPVYSRLPHDDELYVMKAFEKHASHCHDCADPLNTHRLGYNLCARGNDYAANVAQYVYNKDGLAYSLVDRKARQRMRLEIPADLISLRRLLTAWEAGMMLKQQVAKRERRLSSEAVVAPVIEKRRVGRKTPSHRRNYSSGSSDHDLEFDNYDTSYHHRPASYPPARRYSVVYRVPSSPTQPMMIYPR